MGTDDLHKKAKAERLVRKAKQKTESPRILILTEGETDEYYFKGLKNRHRLPTVDVKKSSGSNPKSIMKNAKILAKESAQQGNEFDYVFCVFDLDVQAATQFVNDIQNLNGKGFFKETKIQCIVSYPCIEFWFVLHFNEHTSPFGNTGNKSVGDVAVGCLQKYMPAYRKADTKIFERLHPYLDVALINAKKVRALNLKNDTINPSTNIDGLVDFLSDINSPPAYFESLFK